MTSPLLPSAITDDCAFAPTSEDRDRPLSFHWRLPGHTWLSGLNLRPLPPRLGRVRASILLEAILAHHGGWPRVSYSRRRAFYASKQRYRGTDLTYDTVVPMVDELTRDSWLGNWIAPANPGLGVQSTFRATGALLAAIPTDRLAGAEHVAHELIRLRDADKQLIDYDDTERTCRMRRMLKQQNEALRSTRITLTGPDVCCDGPLLRIGGTVVLCPAMKCLHRVFNNADWRQGGRLYGGWWQNAPKDVRPRLQLDGAAVIELDHAQLHPRLLYMAVGRPLEGDAYTLGDWPRPLGKRAFNILLNARTYQSALGAIAHAIGGDQAYAAAAQLIAALKARHAAIARYFHTGVGLRLQNVDADMAEAVLRRLLKQGIVALPVHDSFLVQQRHAGALEEAMAASFGKLRTHPVFCQLKQ